VTLTPNGEKTLLELSKMHYEEAKRIRGLCTTYELPASPRTSKPKIK
jgi:hypothetical protein